jgi:heme/copper-type cytochrome/quinol oxidase subunit 2
MNTATAASTVSGATISVNTTWSPKQNSRLVNAYWFLLVFLELILVLIGVHVIGNIAYLHIFFAKLSDCGSCVEAIYASLLLFLSL